MDSVPGEIRVTRLLGGLASDTEAPMPQEMRHYLESTWKRIQQRIPGTEFNFDFWRLCEPRRSTWRACRAVIAARSQNPDAEERMISAIQRAYYLDACNPSNRETLGKLAKSLGLDESLFLEHLDGPDCQTRLDHEMALCRQLGLTSFPSLALETGGTTWPIAVDYRDPNAMIEQIEMLTESAAN